MSHSGQHSFMLHELEAFDGKDSTTPIYISIKGKVYDVSSSRQFYGPGSPYHAFAGKEASRGLALMSTDATHLNQSDLSDLNEEQKETLDGWIKKFESKYPIVGHIKDAQLM